MNNKQRILKSFSIKKLFGTTDVMIPFEDTAKVLIGENGLGKTQVLSILYYTLAAKFNKLIEYVFDSVTIEFVDHPKMIIDKSDINKITFDLPIVREAIKIVGLDKFLQLRDAATNPKNPDPLVHLLLENKLSYSSYNVIVEALKLINALKVDRKESLFTPISAQKQAMMNSHLEDYEILYLPTFRLAEEDLHNLDYDEDKFGFNPEDTRFIHFGMDDVKKRFSEVTQSIEKLSKEGFAKLSSEILSQLVKGLPIIDNHFLHTIQQKDIDIILARVGDEMTIEDKNRIKNMVATKEIQVKDHSLLYFLQKLINIYNQQRNLDESIKIFRDVCNQYLINKKLIYDESRIQIYIQLDGNAEKLPLNKLSAGEKQIISIFSKIYLAPTTRPFIVLFDEPELSLSIFWQKNLLPDIFNSGKCSFLLAMTHSPFIFDNELDKYAIGLNQYLKPSKSLTA